MWTAQTFQVEVPEVYQIEVTNNCNLRCPTCIREDPRVIRKKGFLNPDLIDLMAKRGDFEGSYFVELQFAGEPLLHPDLSLIIDKLHTARVKVGLSTNGTLIGKKTLPALGKLDYLTISVDSPIHKEYQELRQAKLNDLIKKINLVMEMPIVPIVDLQAILFKDSRLAKLKKLAVDNNWKVTCREVPDCFAAYQGRWFPPEPMSELCLNPWLSVSVHWDGSVVPCCFAFGRQVVYGDLWVDSLKDIWSKSMTRKALIRRMKKGLYAMPCDLCYMRSPVLFHMRMLMENMKC